MVSTVVPTLLAADVPLAVNMVFTRRKPIRVSVVGTELALTTALLGDR